MPPGNEDGGDLLLLVGENWERDKLGDTSRRKGVSSNMLSSIDDSVTERLMPRIGTFGVRAILNWGLFCVTVLGGLGDRIRPFLEFSEFQEYGEDSI